MGIFDRRTASVLLTILLFAGVLAIAWTARRPIIAFIFAIFFAHLLEPLVGAFGVWFRASRGKAVAITYLGIFVALVLFGFTVGPRIMQQGQRLQEALPDLLEKVKSGNIAWQLGNERGWSYQTEARVQEWLVQHQGDIEHYARNIRGHLGQIAADAAWILLVPVLAVFFLKDRSKLGSEVLNLISAANNRAFLKSVMNDLDTMLAQYVRAQLLLSLFAFIAYGAFLLIVGLPYALAIAAIAGVLEFVPFVGPLVSLGILVSIAFLTGYSHWFLLVGFWLVWRGVQDYVNAPRVLGGGMELHPLLVIFAILVGGEVAGVLGIFFSIPAVATVRILWLNWSRRTHVRNAA